MSATEYNHIQTAPLATLHNLKHDTLLRWLKNQPRSIRHSITKALSGSLIRQGEI